MQSTASAPAPAVSVVVCTYKGASTLGACLAALDRQTIAERAEVIVVVDGSHDGSDEIAAAHGARVIVHERNRGLSEARNSGIAAARAPVVAFTDDDCAPADDWLARLLPPYERPEVGGVGGSVGIARVETAVHRYLAEHNPLAPLELELDVSDALAYRLWLYLKRTWAPAPAERARAVRSFAGANMSFRAAVLEAAGGFDPSMRFGADDEYICSQVRALEGAPVLWFEPAATVRHDYRGTLADLFRRNYAYGLGHARDFAAGAGGRFPIVFPAPILLAAALPLVRSPRAAAVLAVGSQLAYPQGLKGALLRRRAGNLVFSFMRLVEEGAHDAGMAAGLLRATAGRTRKAGP